MVVNTLPGGPAGHWASAAAPLARCCPDCGEAAGAVLAGRRTVQPGGTAAGTNADAMPHHADFGCPWPMRRAVPGAIAWSMTSFALDLYWRQ